MSERKDKGKRQLSEAELAQRRAAAEKGGRAPRSGYTMSPKALAQRRQAAEHSTGPLTKEGKARSSRNAWKHGMYSKANEAWRMRGMGMIARPCRTTCPVYPCSLVQEGLTDKGGDCLDKTAYLEAFDSLMDTLYGEPESARGMIAANMAQAMEVLSQMREAIAEDGVLIRQPMMDKQGEIVGHKLEANPALLHYHKMLTALGLNLPELLATPRAIAKTDDEEDGADAVSALFQRLGRAARGGDQARVIDAPGDDE